MEAKYEIKDIFGEQVLIIGFNDKKYIGLEDLLNTDSLSLYELIEKIEKVASNNSNFEEIGNERMMVEITPKKIEIYDSFDGLVDETELNPTINLTHDEFKKIVVSWNEKRNSFYSK